ncbi:MAG: hypothetical protein HY392_02920 [Candidatus Diapherotrites archaeon]|nr:hypothetical protein [Candidatus Diapherotrites archaeon]
MKNLLLFFLAALAVLLAGCLGGNISGSAFSADPSFSVEKVRQLINDPNVLVTEKTLGGAAISASLNGAAAGCVGLLPEKQYVLVEASAPATNYSIVLDGDKVMCVMRKERLADECSTAGDCDDGLSSTTDSCSGTPKICLSQRTTECKSGDSFCPASCLKGTDSDCVRECFVDSTCDDSDLTTKDYCGGALQRCIHEKLFVGGKEVIACSADEECVAENVCSTGSCVEGLCVFGVKPNGTVCDSSKDMECFDGECVKATENPIRLVKTKLEWVNDDSPAGKVLVTANASKLSIFEGKYGTDLSFMKSVFDVECSTGACFKRTSIDHSVEFTDLVVAQEYYYTIFAFGLSELTVSKTETLSFFTCPGRCDDSDECTADSCDISTGKCDYKKDEQNPSC